MMLLLSRFQKIFEKVCGELFWQFPFQADSIPLGDSFCWAYEDHDLAIELGAALNHNDINELMALDPDLFYMEKMYLSTWEYILMYFFFGSSCLCFLYASFILLEALVVFGLQRCQQKLQAWNLFIAAKHRRL
jgi:hypothetical protein